MADNWKMFLVSGIMVAFLAVLPLLTEMGPYPMRLLIMLFISVILAQSWNLMGGYAGQINLGLAAFFGCGALTTRLIWGAGAPFYLAILAGSVAAVILAGVIGIPSLRLRGMYFSIGTLALAQALMTIVGNVFPTTLYASPAHFLSFSLAPRYYLGLALAAGATLAVHIVANSRLGLALLAIRDDEEAAKVMGINIFKYKVLVFIISSFMAGIAGGVLTYFHLSILPFAQFTPHWSFGPLMAVAIGGMGTVIGPILGSVFIQIFSEIFALTLGKAHYIVFGIFFILVVLFLPGGIVEAVDRSRKFLARMSRFRYGQKATQNIKGGDKT